LRQDFASKDIATRSICELNLRQACYGGKAFLHPRAPGLRESIGTRGPKLLHELFERLIFRIAGDDPRVLLQEPLCRIFAFGCMDFC
jgi:hypothetical protein